nr:MAG TPA: hypothetical protein [Caudoviricetes sp.]
MSISCIYVCDVMLQRAWDLTFLKGYLLCK